MNIWFAVFIMVILFLICSVLAADWKRNREPLTFVLSLFVELFIIYLGAHGIVAVFG